VVVVVIWWAFCPSLHVWNSCAQLPGSVNVHITVRAIMLRMAGTTRLCIQPGICGGQCMVLLLKMKWVGRVASSSAVGCLGSRMAMIVLRISSVVVVVLLLLRSSVGCVLLDALGVA